MQKTQETWVQSLGQVYLSFPKVTKSTVMNLERIEMVDATLSKRIYVTVASIVEGSLAIHVQRGLARLIINIDRVK